MPWLTSVHLVQCFPERRLCEYGRSSGLSRFPHLPAVSGSGFCGSPCAYGKAYRGNTATGIVPDSHRIPYQVVMTPYCGANIARSREQCKITCGICFVDLSCGFVLWICFVDLFCGFTLPGCGYCGGMMVWAWGEERCATNCIFSCFCC